MAFTLDWFANSVLRKPNQAIPQPQQLQGPARSGFNTPGYYQTPNVSPSYAMKPTQLIPQPQQLQQGPGQPPRVPGPRNPMGRKRVPQVPQAMGKSNRINRMNWIDFFRGGGKIT